MGKAVERYSLTHGSPGTKREVLVHRYGQDATGGKAYLQASIHADETPALLTLHHLLRLLDRAERDSAITGEIVIVPYANPIGLDQFVNAGHTGRYELAGGGNFNRNWPDLSDAVIERLRGQLTDDESANIAKVRQALRETVESLPVASELDSLRKTLAGLAIDSDIVLDLHCDDDALMHLYILETHWPDASDLAAELGCRAILLSDDSGGGPFDECCSTPWLRLKAAFPDRPIPPACLGGTVELRGRPDVSEELAHSDAQGLYRTLQHKGFIAGDPGPAPEALCEATLLTACEVLKSPATGVLSYMVATGDIVRKGDIVAWLIDPAAEDPEAGRQAIRAGTDGLVLSRRVKKYVRAGWSVAKIVGDVPLQSRAPGALLEQ